MDDGLDELVLAVGLVLNRLIAFGFGWISGEGVNPEGTDRVVVVVGLKRPPGERLELFHPLLAVKGICEIFSPVG